MGRFRVLFLGKRFPSRNSVATFKTIDCIMLPISAPRTRRVGAVLTTVLLTLWCAMVYAQTPAQPPSGFGSNLLVFSPSMPMPTIQREINRIYATQQHSEFSPERYALMFLPGRYNLDVPVGFYTQIIGLGASPDDVRISGDVHADASGPHNNATTTFWRGIEGVSVVPTGGTMKWAVSQGLSAACTCSATWSCISTTDGPAAAGCPTA